MSFDFDFNSVLDGAKSLIPGGNLLGDFSDSNSLLGKANDFWGSFTGTPAEQFMNSGLNTLKGLKSDFQANFLSNPTSAVNAYEKGVNQAKGRYIAALANSSQSKTRNGNKKSLEDVKKAIKDWDSWLKSKSSDYDFKTISVKNDTYKVGKHRGAYSWRIFNVVKKPTTNNTKIQSKQYLDLDNKENQNLQKPLDKNIIYIIVGALFLFLFRKKLF